MNLKDCLDHLALGELANTNLVDNDQIKDTKVSYVVSLINEALLRLYSKFCIKLDSVYVEMNEVVTRYELTKDHLQLPEDLEGFDFTNPPCVIDYQKYLFSTPSHPFTENILKVLEVTRDDGYIYPLNDRGNDFSIFTPSFNVLQVPFPIPERTLSVIYQAKHPYLSKESLEANIELPDSFFGGFFAYLGYLAYNNQQSEGASAMAQKFYQNYLMLCEEIITYDLGNTSYSQSNIKFNKYGWC